MSYILRDIDILIPEAILVLGTIMTLLYGIFCRGSNISTSNSQNSALCSGFSNFSERNVVFSRHVGYLSIAMLFVTLFFLHLISGVEKTALENSIESNSFVVSAKYIILLSVIGSMLIAVSSDNIKKMPFEVFVLMLFSTVGMMLVISSNDLLVLYLALELMSLATYVIVAYLRDSPTASEAALKYFILGALASGIYLFGCSMIYGFAGSINFDSIGEYYLSSSAASASLSAQDGALSSVPIGFIVGMVLILVAFCFKMSAAPFHMWTPDVYQGSPTIVTTFIATASKAAVVLFFIKLLYGVMFDLVEEWQRIAIFTSIASLAIGSFGAIMQQNIKRLIAYSSIAHIGFIILAIASSDFAGIHSAVTYTIIYLVMTATIFAILFALRFKNGEEKENIKQLAGLGKNNPVLAFSISVIMFSMAGVPPFAGFFAKFFVLLSVVKQELYPAAVFAVVCAAVSSFYYLRVVKVMYFDDGDSDNLELKSLLLKFMILLGVLFNMLYIMVPEVISKFVEVGALKLWE
ncbi:NADH-quinone oxidoreductase subunit N [Candidatus Lariskella endosymbiont of Epinotia ramella]|uniref:NADH-quinone oxidoreductase subunit N n=1 Tax=Candidatus Lariskella endosymbiont of Epinotia ramella TaxID=3066224 RepID=UPI0030D1AAB2